MDFWPAPEAWRPWIRRARTLVVLGAGLVSAAALIAVHGVGGEEKEHLARTGFQVAAWALGLELVLKAWLSPRWSRFLRARAIPLVLLAVVVVQAAVLRLGGGSGPTRPVWLGLLTQGYLISLQIFILGSLTVEAVRVNRRLAHLRVRPGRLVLGLFAGLILGGAALLLLPRATVPGVDLSWVDALFTATSAVCVTGLVVRDTGADFSLLGQGIILALIQLGGLGIMSVTAFWALVGGRGLGVRERAVLADLLHAQVAGQVVQLLRGIILLTFAVEAVGALLLWPMLGRLGVPDPLGHAVFHSISAFCNAGFSTFDDSLIRFSGAPEVQAVIMLLIILGGLGFSTLLASPLWLWSRLRGRRRRLPLSARLIWSVSGLLWLAGFIFACALEWNGALSSLAPGERIWAAAFHSVTTRTAGFSTIDVAALAPPTLLLTMILMFIGGAPGSTAGGIKVTTLAVMAGAVAGIFRGVERVQLGRRRVDPGNVREALGVVFLGGLAVLAGMLLLLVVEDRPFLPLAFEAVSALGTVGLSTGITPHLGDAARLILVGLMFLGRLGPLTLVLAAGGRRPHSYDYPTEHVPVG
jgi:trk system potassium uptake protein TrkH